MGALLAQWYASEQKVSVGEMGEKLPEFLPVFQTGHCVRN